MFKIPIQKCWFDYVSFVSQISPNFLFIFSIYMDLFLQF